MEEVNQTPLVSIIVPAYNAGKFVAATLDSAIAQTEQSWELIAVNDGSKDNTHEVLTDYARLDSRITAITQENGGVAKARNVGLAASNPGSTYVIFLDSDDVWFPNSLEILRTRLEECPNCLGVHGLAQSIDSEGRPFGDDPLANHTRKYVDGLVLKVLPEESPTGLSSLVYVNLISTTGLVLLRRSGLPEDGAFDENRAIHGCEDWDTWMRIAAKGDIAFVPKVVLGYRRHEANNSSRRPEVRASHLYFANKMLTSNYLSNKQKHLVRYGYRLREVMRIGYWCSFSLKAAVRGKMGDFAKGIRHATPHVFNVVQGL